MFPRTTMSICHVMITHKKDEPRIVDSCSYPFSHLSIRVDIVVEIIEVVPKKNTKIKILLLFNDPIGTVPLEMYVRND